MTAFPEDDRTSSGHLERQASTTKQTDSLYSVRLVRSHSRFGKTATAAFCAQVGRKSLNGTNVLCVTGDLIGCHVFPCPRRCEEYIHIGVDGTRAQHQASGRTRTQLTKAGQCGFQVLQVLNLL